MDEIPVFGWFDEVPADRREEWLTRNLLAAQGLRPRRGAQPVARVEWRNRYGERFALLYDRAQAEPKPAPTPAQLAALEKARARLRTCRWCGVDQGFTLPRRWRPGDCQTCEDRRIQADREDAARIAREAMADLATVILDTETTDLDGYLVEIAIIDTAGEVLFNSRVNPQHPIGQEAQRIHHITEADLADAPTFAQIRDDLARACNGRRIWTYNADFDCRIIANEVERLTEARALAERFKDDPDAEAKARELAYKRHRKWHRAARRQWRCLMDLYAQFVGDWSDYHEDYRWQPLPGGDHSALGDAQAALAVLRRMAEQE